MASRITKLSQHLRASAVAQEEPHVLYEMTEDGIAVISFNRPAMMNALSMVSQEAYIAALKRADADKDVKVIVVTGKGRAFCVGADMKASFADQKAKKAAGTPQNSKAYKIEHVAQIHATRIDKPVLVAINGPCAGLGFAAAMMGDVRFCLRKAKFTTAFVKRGLVVEHGLSFILPRVIGNARALDLLLSARQFDGEEAMQLGVVNRLFDTQEELMVGMMAYAKAMATECSPAAMAEAKRQVYSDWENTLEGAFQNSADLLRKNFTHPDVAEGIASYVEKRAPNFEGIRNSKIRDL